MSAHPEDIMQAARAIGASSYRGNQWEHMRKLFLGGHYDNHPVISAAADALMAEREKWASKGGEA